MGVEVDGGFVAMNDFRVSVAEMASWEPERIYAFFEGIATMVIAAKQTPSQEAPASGEK